jgi:hypothetical protein
MKMEILSSDISILPSNASCSSMPLSSITNLSYVYRKIHYNASHPPIPINMGSATCQGMVGIDGGIGLDGDIIQDNAMIDWMCYGYFWNTGVKIIHLMKWKWDYSAEK